MKQALVAGGPDRRTALALLVAGTFFMENLDATVITPAIPAMAHSFSVRPVELSAGVSAYMLTLGVFIPVSGWMAERFGARRIFSMAIVVFTLASLLCGLAQSLPEFILARIAQGIGGAMMVPVGRLVVLRETPKDRLIQAIAVLTWPALVAPVLGPPLGGLLVVHADWRWIFWLNLPLGLIAFFAAQHLVPRLEDTTLRAFDWPGFLMTGTGIFALMLGAEILSRPEAGLAVAGGAILAGLILLTFAIRHLNRAKDPMLRLSALKTQTFSVTIWGGSLFRMGVSAVPFLLPLMLQLGFGYSPFAAGAMLMAVFAGNLTMKPMTTPVMRRFGLRRVLVVNGWLNALLIAACALLSPGLPVWVICLVLFVGGMSRSMQFTGLNSIAFADIEKADMRDANTLFSTAFQLAMGLGIALGALSWRVGEMLAPSADAATSFRIAFVLVGIIAALGTIDSMRLAQGAGHSVTSKPKSEPKGA